MPNTCSSTPFATSFLLAVLLAASGARAEATSGPFVPCGLSGRTTLPLDTPIEEASGRTIARFSGGEATVTVSGFSLGSASRTRVETGNGRGGFRLRGFIDTASLPVVTAQALPVAAGHLGIAKDQRVQVVGASAERLRVERKAAPPLKGAVSTFTTCKGLKLVQGVPPGWSPSGFARGYVLRADSLDLFDGPGGSSVATLYKQPGAAGVLFFSTEGSGPWLRVEYHADLVVDAWARTSSLQALAPGETMDQLTTLAPQRGVPRLTLPGTPRSVRVSREVALRAAARETDAVIGVIEPDAEAYVIDIMAGWVSVMPKALDVLPASGGQFWVKKSELGL
jgi:hypothetical protein